MRSNLNSSKGTGQKAGLNTGYTSSYAQKYKKRGIKSSSQYIKVNNLCQTPKVYIQSGIHQKEQGRQQENCYKETSHIGIRNQAIIKEDQWTGQEPRGNAKNISSQQHSQQRRGEQKQNKMHSFQESQMQQKPMNQMMVKKPSNILIQEEIQQDLDIYHHYRMLEKEYLCQLSKIKEQTEKIRTQSEMERNRITESQETLFYKRKKLKNLEETYNSILQKNQSEAQEQTYMIGKYEQKLETLMRQYDQNKQRNQQQKKSLQNQLLSAQKQNESLQSQLSELQAQFQTFTFEQAKQQKSLSQLQEHHNCLLKSISCLQQQQKRLQQELEQLSSPNQSQALPCQVHKGYLQMYEKVFISAQLHKAEQILRLKDQEKHEAEQLQKKNNMIKDKKVEVSLKEKRVFQKNKLIDKLTQQIREKSTTLLNLYQQQG